MTDESNSRQVSTLPKLRDLQEIIYAISKEAMSGMVHVQWRFSTDAGEKLDTLSPIND